MAVNLAPQAWLPSIDANGDPLVGAKLFTYAAGSSTKQTTYTDPDGLIAQTNPIILNTRGQPNDAIYLTDGQSYKFVLSPSTDTDPPTSPIKTEDDINGINDTASITQDQWEASGLTPTFTTATTFTLTGDQRTAFHVGRRVKTTNTSGTIYSLISVSAYSDPTTTITVVNDSGVLDSGLSDVSYGLLTSTNPSVPAVALPTGTTMPANSITTANLQDNAVTLAKMADITKGKVIVGDSGDDPELQTYMKWTTLSTVTTTSGTEAEFTSIPASATKIRFYIRATSFDASDNTIMQVGHSGAYLTSGYQGWVFDSSGSEDSWSTSALLDRQPHDAAITFTGFGEMSLLESNIWSINSNASPSNGFPRMGTGEINVTAALTRIKFFGVNASDYDAGKITVEYYGNSEV